MNKKTIGIVGVGSHFNKRIYSILSKSKFFEIKGILRKKKKNFKNIKNFSEKDFFKKKFDFIYIATPTKLHEKFIIKSLKNDSHVICEKPFVIRKKNINQILNLSKSKKKLVFESFAYVYHPVFNFIKKEITNKKYGNLRSVISNFRYPSLNSKDNRYRIKDGDGFFYDAACYPISLENYLFDNKKDENLKFYSQKIRKKVDLRGNIQLRSSKLSKFYFWGEGQNYHNNLEIFFNKGTIFVDKFFSKQDNEEIYAKIYFKNKITTKVFKQTSQFKLMFEKIIKNYNNKSFQEYNRRRIKNQLTLLLKYNI
tara:strand:- start:414 stop:1343 length:930 start_codon:yes stop_codon:yes gene_type:complete